jgi:hypothetical protein
MATPEGVIKKLIMDWLNAQPGCYARVITVAGFRGRKNVSKGVVDILGSWQGRALAIEVKQPGEKPTREQYEFLIGWVDRGKGIGIVAESLDDVERVLRPIQVRTE